MNEHVGLRVPRHIPQGHRTIMSLTRSGVSGFGLCWRSMTSRPHPPAQPHGAIREVLPNVFFVTGTLAMSGTMRFSRNMTIVREGERLMIVNSVRLDEAGLAELDKLGKVTT